MNNAKVVPTDTHLTGISEKSDKVNTNYSIEKIENGYILTISKDWKDKKGNYQYDTKRRYFKENPLDDTALKLDTIKKALK